MPVFAAVDVVGEGGLEVGVRGGDLKEPRVGEAGRPAGMNTVWRSGTTGVM